MYIKVSYTINQPIIKVTTSTSNVYVKVSTPSPTFIKIGSDGGGGASESALTLLQYVRNQTGATVTKGTVVYISGATGNTSTISKAIATTDGTSAQTLGLIKDDIENNGFGYVVVFGKVSGLNTSAYNEGDQLYLSPTVAGCAAGAHPARPRGEGHSRAYQQHLSQALLMRNRTHSANNKQNNVVKHLGISLVNRSH